MKLAIHFFIFGSALLSCAPLSKVDPRCSFFGPPELVTILSLPTDQEGLPLSTEEPYPSRDGNFLFFNSGTGEGGKDLHFAKMTTQGWKYAGTLGPGVNTPKEVEGNPTMDRQGFFYFIDSGVPEMVRGGQFSPDGALLGLKPISGIPCRKVDILRQRAVGNMGVEVSANGSTLYFDRAVWRLEGLKVGPILSCEILLLERKSTGFVFDEPHARNIFSNINNGDINYAESISPDDLEIFFTRLSASDIKSGLLRSCILRSTRTTPGEAFRIPEMIASIGDREFVEGPALTDDGHTLYYHKRVGSKFRLYRVCR
jgi:hypothetical protein